MFTVNRVKAELPDVPVKIGKRIVIGSIRGRRNDFATVYVEGARYEYSWETITEALNHKRPLRV